MADSQRICAVDGCDNPVKPGRKGMCGKHYKRSHRYGSPDGFASKRERPVVQCSVEGCNRTSDEWRILAGRCERHHKAHKKYGEVGLAPYQHGEQREWLSANVNHQDDECLTWPFARDRNGYGKIKMGNRNTSAHRVMCEMAHGLPADAKMHAAHACHNGHLGCINPRHLFWQKASENQSNKPRQPRAGRHHFAILGPVDVIGARLLLKSRTQSAVASEFGVSRSVMGQIKRGEIWKSL